MSEILIDPSHPPDFTHTRVKRARVEGEVVDPHWNVVLLRVVGIAARKGMSIFDIRRVGKVNIVERKLTEKGFKPVPGHNISAQYQDANGAFFAIYAIADRLSLEVDLVVEQHDKEKTGWAGKVWRVKIPRRD